MLRTIVELGLLRLQEISTTERRLADQRGIKISVGKETWFKSPPKNIKEYQQGWESNPTLTAFSIAQPLFKGNEPKKKQGSTQEKRFVSHSRGVSEYEPDKYWRYLFRKAWHPKGEEFGLTVSRKRKISKCYIDKKHKQPRTIKRALYRTILSLNELPSIDTSKTFLEMFWDDVKKIERKTMEQSHGICSSCFSEVDDLAWNMRPLPTFIIEKENFFPSLNMAYPGLPLCKPCTYLLAAGRNMIEARLEARLGGMRVFLVPCFLADQRIGQKALKVLVQRVESMQGDIESPWKTREDLLRNFASNQGLISGIHIIFFRRPKIASFEVLAWFPEVLPTRIRDVSNSIEKVIKRHLDSKWLLKSEYDEAKTLRSDFNLLFPFLGEMSKPILKDNRRDKVPAVVVLTYLASIFLDLHFDETRLVRFVHGQLSRTIASRKAWKQAKEQFIRMCFLGAMAIEIYKEVKGMPQSIVQSSDILDFSGLEKHRSLFERSEKQYAFIAGLIFGEMEYVQNIYHGGDFPGLSQSRNLHFTLDDLRRIAKESFQKIHYLSYEKKEKIRVNLQKVKDIYSRLGSLDTTVSRTWDISTEETGFYFSLGWASAQHVFAKEKIGGKHEKK